MEAKTLPECIEYNEDVEQWENYLNTIPQQEIVGFMLDRMIADYKFFELVKSRFVKEDSGRQLKDILAAYDNEIYREYQEKIVDIEYVIAITRNFMRAIDALDSEDDKHNGYSHMVDVIKDGWRNYGLGWPDEDFLLEDILVDLGSSMSEIV